MILAMFLLQATVFQNYVEEARVKLGLAPIEVTISPQEYTFGEDTVAAWVPTVPGGRVYVTNSALAEASNDALKVLAYHESCHHFLKVMETQSLNDYQKQLIHELQRYCTVAAMRDDFRRILRRAKRDSYVNRLGTVIWWRKQCR